MKGVVLAHALLQGARLRDADLEAADLYKANLQGADLRGAKIRGATLLEARVWLTPAPDRDRDATQLIDLSDLVARPPSDIDLKELADAVQQVEPSRLRERIADTVGVLTQAATRNAWPGPDRGYWTDLQGIAAAGLADGFRGRLSDYLWRLACRQVWADGSVGTGIARRAAGPEFRGDVSLLHDRLKSDDCPASKTISRRAMRRLLERVEQGG
jgi:hypothetical protein